MVSKVFWDPRSQLTSQSVLRKSASPLPKYLAAESNYFCFDIRNGVFPWNYVNLRKSLKWLVECLSNSVCRLRDHEKFWVTAFSENFPVCAFFVSIFSVFKFLGKLFGQGKGMISRSKFGNSISW